MRWNTVDNQGLLKRTTISKVYYLFQHSKSLEQVTPPVCSRVFVEHMKETALSGVKFRMHLSIAITSTPPIERQGDVFTIWRGGWKRSCLQVRHSDALWESMAQSTFSHKPPCVQCSNMSSLPVAECLCEGERRQREMAE